MTFLFDTNSKDVKDDREYTPIKDGNHVCQIVRAHSTKSRSGKNMLAMEFKIVDPVDGDKNKRFQSWFVYNSDPKDFGTAKLIKLCRAAEIVGSAVDPNGLDPTDQKSVWDNMLGKSLVIRTYQEESDDGYTNIRTGGFYQLKPHHKKALSEAYGEQGPELSDFSYQTLKGDPIRVDGFGGASDDPFGSMGAQSADDLNIPF